MQYLAKYLFLPFLLLLPGIAPAQTKWTPYETSISFKIKNFGFNVDGSFKGFSGNLLFDPNALESSSLSGSVDAATINTGNSTRDSHLRSDDYFDAEQYKRIEIHSNSLYRKAKDFAGEFNITIRGVTKQKEIPFSFTTNGENGMFTGEFTINRRDFGVGSGSLVLSDDVTVSIVVNARK